MANSSAGGKSRCVHPSLEAGAGGAGRKTSAKANARTVSLPVVGGANSELGTRNSEPTIRPSRSGKRRAIVLGVVQVLMIAHIGLWILSKKYGWFGGGNTTTPIEPSESMEFVKDGVINAGLIFFSIALLSTLILGRWFCGWGCHIVLLQDLCGWFMKKCGVRPKPFRSRFLIYVPLILALYMFVWPAAYRWGVLPMQTWLAGKVSWIEKPAVAPPWKPHAKLTTTEFWRTFPGVLVAIPFVGICGFATVYFLGAKGFCTYGCPYGGFFAPLDKFASGRIRVTDACEGCGHCTAVCTSNVRVHDEVREYGMVVDPGCMKCLDCVIVCPNEALYFGFGAPAVAKGAAKNETPKRKYDLTLGEEFLCAAVFLGTFMSVRGVYGLIPMLMAAGVAGCVTFIAWKAWRLLRDANVTLHHFQLKFKSRWRLAGVVFAACAVLTLALVAHCGMMKYAHAAADRAYERVDVDAAAVSTGVLTSVDDADRAQAREALRWYTRASAMWHGGWGLASAQQDQIDSRRAQMLCALDDFNAAEALLRESFRENENEATAVNLARFLSDRPDLTRQREAMELYERVLRAHPEYDALLADYQPWALARGRLEPVLQIHEARLKQRPLDKISLRAVAMLLLQGGRLNEGLAAAKRWTDAEPRNGDAHHWLAIAYASSGQADQAIASARLALQFAEASHAAASREMLAQMLEAAGRTMEADAVRRSP